MQRRCLYEKLRASYNSALPPECLPAPPYEECRSISDICDHARCRYFLNKQALFEDAACSEGERVVGYDLELYTSQANQPVLVVFRALASCACLCRVWMGSSKLFFEYRLLTNIIVGSVYIADVEEACLPCVRSSSREFCRCFVPYLLSAGLDWTTYFIRSLLRVDEERKSDSGVSCSAATNGGVRFLLDFIVNRAVPCCAPWVAGGLPRER